MKRGGDYSHDLVGGIAHGAKRGNTTCVMKHPMIGGGESVFIVLHRGPVSQISYDARWSSIEGHSFRRIFCTRQEKVDKPPVLPRVDNCHTYVLGKRAYPLNEFGSVEAGKLGDSRGRHS